MSSKSERKRKRKLKACKREHADLTVLALKLDRLLDELRNPPKLVSAVSRPSIGRRFVRYLPVDVADTESCSTTSCA